MRAEHTNHLLLYLYPQIPLQWKVQAPQSWDHYVCFLLPFPMKIPGKWGFWYNEHDFNYNCHLAHSCIYNPSFFPFCLLLIQWQKRVVMTLGLKSNNDKNVAKNFKLPTFSKSVISHQQRLALGPSSWWRLSFQERC